MRLAFQDPSIELSAGCLDKLKEKAEADNFLYVCELAPDFPRAIVTSGSMCRVSDVYFAIGQKFDRAAFRNKAALSCKSAFS